MNMHKLYRLKEMLCKEVDEIAEKGEMSAGDLETAHKLTDTVKNIDKIIMLEEAGEYSGDDMSSRSYSRGYDRSYGDNDGYSGYRGQNRDRMGRYSREGGSSYDSGNYSGNDDYSGRTRVRGYYRDDIKDKLAELMQEAGTEKERKAIQRAMDSME